MSLNGKTVAVLSMAGMLVFAVSADEARAKGFSLDKHRKVLTPVTYKNLTLFPVVSTRKGAPTKYIVLDDGMKRGLVKVHERKGGGTVSRLKLSNRSNKPLFLMAGEVIVGGKQDRIIGKDTIIGARSSEDVPVFCVEHGRWSGRKASFSTAKALGHMELRKRAKFASQGAVWKEVAKKNAMRKLSNKTQTYRHVASGKKFKQSIDAYARFFARALGRRKHARQVGFIVAFNGKIVAVELFGSSQLFHQMRGKLLRSYYVEAIDRAVKKNAHLPKATDVRKFMARAKRARKRRKVMHKNAAAETYNFEDSVVQGAMIKAPKAKPSAEPAYDSVYVK